MANSLEQKSSFLNASQVPSVQWGYCKRVTVTLDLTLRTYPNRVGGIYRPGLQKLSLSCVHRGSEKGEVGGEESKLKVGRDTVT